MAKDNFILSKELLHDLFEYRDGELFWKKTGKGRRLDLKAGNLRPDGRTDIYLQNKLYRSHRIIYMMFYGEMPEEIDHIDGNPKNNKIENLRKVKHSENMQNVKLTKANTSGVKNVHWFKRDNTWQVQLRVNGLRKHIGYFDDFEFAALVATEARNKYHGEFANHG